MRASGASGLPAPDPLPSHTHFRFRAKRRTCDRLQLGTGEDLKPSEVVLVQILDRVEQVAVEGHQATCTGANNRVTVRRSVSVHP